MFPKGYEFEYDPATIVKGFIGPEIGTGSEAVLVAAAVTALDIAEAQSTSTSKFIISGAKRLTSTSSQRRDSTTPTSAG